MKKLALCYFLKITDHGDTYRGGDRIGGNKYVFGSGESGEKEKKILLGFPPCVCYKSKEGLFKNLHSLSLQSNLAKVRERKRKLSFSFFPIHLLSLQSDTEFM